MYGEEGIGKIMQQNFQQLFQTSSPSGIAAACTAITRQLKDAEVALLGESFVGEEVKQALFMMHPTKSPGPDGFHAAFIRGIGIL